MSTDWVDDESLSREQTLARFRALHPEPTVGPLPAGAHIIKSVRSFNAVVTTFEEQRGRTTGFVVSQPQTSGV